MTAQEFCYWLQGAFEIAQITRLTDAQVRVISNHLDLVEKTNPEHECMFVAWLATTLRGSSGTSERETARIARMLGAQFRHVIDDGHNPTLQKVHDGGTGGTTLMRC